MGPICTKIMLEKTRFTRDLFAIIKIYLQKGKQKIYNQDCRGSKADKLTKLFKSKVRMQQVK
jgi:hypothetical protein